MAVNFLDAVPVSLQNPQLLLLTSHSPAPITERQLQGLFSYDLTHSFCIFWEFVPVTTYLFSSCTSLSPSLSSLNLPPSLWDHKHANICACIAPLPCLLALFSCWFTQSLFSEEESPSFHFFFPHLHNWSSDSLSPRCDNNLPHLSLFSSILIFNRSLTSSSLSASAFRKAALPQLFLELHSEPSSSHSAPYTEASKVSILHPLSNLFFHWKTPCN